MCVWTWLLKGCHSWDCHICFQERNTQFLILERPTTRYFKCGGEMPRETYSGEGQNKSSSHEKMSPKAELGGKHFLLVLRWTCIITFKIGQASDEEQGEGLFRSCCLLAGKAFTKWNDPCLAVSACIIKLPPRCLRGSFNYC